MSNSESRSALESSSARQEIQTIREKKKEMVRKERNIDSSRNEQKRQMISRVLSR